MQIQYHVENTLFIFLVSLNIKIANFLLTLLHKIHLWEQLIWNNSENMKTDLYL